LPFARTAAGITMRIIRTVLAENDLLDIWLYIAQDNVDAADRLLEKLQQRCDCLSANPELGMRRDDLLEGMRCLIEGNYCIFYRITDDAVQVLRILHGTRDFPSIFQHW
jgi:toxin ParE1/3/4